ncbi:Thioredoxin F-type [Scenedesmus sp. PABB004]|nr:Thioredoxin F-type [Scenedesmus sp. PABB004]
MACATATQRCLCRPCAAPALAARPAALRRARCAGARPAPATAAARMPHLTLDGAPRGSLDPEAASRAKQQAAGGGGWAAGVVLTVTSPEHFDGVLAAHPDRLAVLMCKSHSCRPCKMFTRKYLAVAEKFPEVVVAEVFGDDSPELRKMMIGLGVKVTPTFRLYRGGECVDVVTGTNDKKLVAALLARLAPAELANHAAEVAEAAAAAAEEAAAAAAAAAAEAAAEAAAA